LLSRSPKLATTRGIPQCGDEIGKMTPTKIFAAIALAAAVYAGSEPALELKVLHRAPLTSHQDSSGLIAFLAKGQTVSVLELGERMYYVVARTPTGDARGWIDASLVEAPPAELMEKIRERRKHAATNRGLIARHEVAAGMTRDELRASIGEPDSRMELRLPDGSAAEQWSYVTYRYLPTYAVDTDAAGKSRRVVSYRRLPAGRKIVTFRGDEVVALEDETK
jgi:hypothetical protein